VDTRSGYADKAFTLIKWVDSWKKLFILVALTVFGILSLLVYQNRVELSTELFKHFGRIQIDQSRIDAEAVKLLADTGGVSVAVWSINFTSNQRTALYVRIKDQRMINQEGLSDLALRKSSQLTADIIELIDNKAFCWEHVANTAVGRSARESGVTYVCAAAIPPEFGAMVGMLAVGFESPPANEDFVKFRLKQAAERMIK
jgi:hypothetical protein